MPQTGSPGRSSRFYLESIVEGGSQLRRIALLPLPFRVGRLSRLPLPLASDSVSKEHAELGLRDGVLWLRDLASRNGTFVNGLRVEESALREGDIVHFADVEFRVAREDLSDTQEGVLEPSTVAIGEMELPEQFVDGARELPELLRDRRVTTLFQPIVALPSGALAGYEALGRGTHPRLPEAPLELFRVAEAVGAERELSRVFREKALFLASQRPRFPMLFLNVHGAEVEDPSLVSTVAEARRSRPQLRLTLEIHDSALEDLGAVDELREQLGRIGVGLAYDGFGAGQARLLELAEVPPHYLKFASGFVRAIDSAPGSRQQLLSSLVTVAREMLVLTVAEGVETAEEAEVCRRIGFTHAQGYFFGEPKPIDAL
jgi:EAL domain-containing protein (putative c-di-GMP-specific phosphodiesterase class I)